jgi:protein-S-isoprenylcysteine O-methyltransferase Ste14
MVNLAGIVQIVCWVWAALEVALMVFTRRNGRGARPHDRGSRPLLWCVIAAGIAAGTAAQAVSAAGIQMPEPWWRGISLILLVSGLIVRGTAIFTLGRFFSTSVTVHPDHQLIRTGLFRLVRHPSYSGLILLFLGMGLSFGNWLSLAVVVIPFMAALLYRIHVEESCLAESLGQAYVDYRRSTKCLLPGIF